MGLGLIYITHPNEEEAEALCNSLLEEKLIACANLFPIKSIFHWNNDKSKENEVVSLIKFNNNKIDEIEKRIKELHSYEVPCIINISATANTEFEKWVNNQ